MAPTQLQFCDTFEGYSIGPVAAPWRVVSEPTSWAIHKLDRPRQNHDFWPIVDSPTMHVAFPVMDRCPVTGRLYVVYRQGYTHATSLAPRDGAIMMLVSDDGGKTWSSPRCIFNDPDYDDRNAAVGVMNDGTVVVCWDQYLNRWHHRALAMVSKDGGESWSQPMRLGSTENLACRSRPIQLSNGQWLFPVYCHYGVAETGSFAVLMDPHTGHQDQIAIPDVPDELGGGDEVTVCETEPGRILSLIRSEDCPWLIQSWSEDYGQTWSERQLTSIPSQFAPCDLLKLPGGRIGCAFSFRERRNERLVISEDGGRTWDVENSLDIFDATVGVSDRSYVSSALLDDNTVGSVLYETDSYPRGGRVWFARTDLRAYGATQTTCLHHANVEEDDVVSVALDGSECTVCVRYRFTGLFVQGKQGGIELRLRDSKACVGFSYRMGIDHHGAWESTNRWELKTEWGAQRQQKAGSCNGDSFNDGNEHTLVLSYRGGKVAGVIDDHRQVEAHWPGLKPENLEVVAHNASLAVYKVEVWR